MSHSITENCKEYNEVHIKLNYINFNFMCTYVNRKILDSFFSYLNKIDTSYNKNKWIPYLKLFSDILKKTSSIEKINCRLHRYFILRFFESIVQCNNLYGLLEQNFHILDKIKLNDGNYYQNLESILEKSKYVHYKYIYDKIKTVAMIKDITIDYPLNEMLLNTCAFNYDDRVFKLVINELKYIPNDIVFFNKLTNHPCKYILKRLKYINKYINDDDLKKKIIHSVSKQHNNNENNNIIFSILKYYYINENYTIHKDILNTIICNMYINNVNPDLLYKLFKILKTKDEKIYFSINILRTFFMITDINYINFNYLTENEFFEVYKNIKNNKLFNNDSLKKYNFSEFSFYLNLIIEKLHSNKYFTNFIKDVEDNKIEKYSEKYCSVYGYQDWSDNSNPNIGFFMLPYIKNMNFLQNTRINYLHIKLKIFINKYRRNKNITRNLLFKPVLFELKNLHTIKYLNFGKNDVKTVFNKVPPSLMFPNQLELINNFLIKEKADGELVDRLPENINPEFTFGGIIKAEYIEYLDLYLVFDIDINLDIVGRYKYLRNMHKYTKNTNLEKVNSMDELINSIKEERQIFNEFLNEDYPTFRWYPKCAWEVSKMDYNFIKDIYDFINIKSKYNEFILTDGEYENDGFIISSMYDNSEIKIKPKNLMTIDLEYNGNNFIDREKNKYKIKTEQNISNGIYRCYPINGEFVAKDIRFDKNKANPGKVVDNIINLSKIDYQINSKLYYTKNDNFKNDLLWKNIIKNNFKNLKVINESMYENENILDLGCGKSKVLKLKVPYKTYTGYDYDSYILHKNNKISSNNITFNYVDLSNKWDETENRWYSVKYDKYMNIYAINSLMHFNTDIFWEQIDKVSTKGTRILFNILKSNKEKEILWVDKNSYLKQKKNIIELYFENVHSEPLIEKYITINDVNSYLEKYNFKMINKYTSNNDDITDLYNWHVFEKMN